LGPHESSRKPTKIYSKFSENIVKHNLHLLPSSSSCTKGVVASMFYIFTHDFPPNRKRTAHLTWEVFLFELKVFFSSLKPIPPATKPSWKCLLQLFLMKTSLLLIKQTKTKKQKAHKHERTRNLWALSVGTFRKKPKKWKINMW
jgi:hypothetical protein